MAFNLFGESKTTRKISKHRGKRGTSFQRWRCRRFQWLTKNAIDFAWIKAFEIPIVPAEFIISDGEISFSYWLVWWYWWVNHPCLIGTFQFLCLTPHLSWFVAASRPIISILCTQKRSMFYGFNVPLVERYIHPQGVEIPYQQLGLDIRYTSPIVVIFIYIHTYIHTYIHIYMHIFIYAHIYIYRCLCWSIPCWAIASPQVVVV